MDKENISFKLAELRKAKGLSQTELAVVCGVSKQAVSKWERSESIPDIEILLTLSKLYGLSMNEIIDDGKVEKNRYYLVFIISMGMSLLVFFGILIPFYFDINNSFYFDNNNLDFTGLELFSADYYLVPEIVKDFLYLFLMFPLLIFLFSLFGLTKIIKQSIALFVVFQISIINFVFSLNNSILLTLRMEPWGKGLSQYPQYISALLSLVILIICTGYILNEDKIKTHNKFNKRFYVGFVFLTYITITMIKYVLNGAGNLHMSSYTIFFRLNRNEIDSIIYISYLKQIIASVLLVNMVMILFKKNKDLIWYIIILLFLLFNLITSRHLLRLVFLNIPIILLFVFSYFENIKGFSSYIFKKMKKNSSNTFE